ncbi:MAG TPA: bifunctional hydroxymethylpyrimidine kinase/phosphomethylpyrimidine kinase [Thermoanaerobaculia bacterium]|nr:bifunctional hydroxymethylpyrimidine kinase/phosphomethylpyrimidine kinase [Thermoanaerobaculia bacterium]
MNSRACVLTIAGSDSGGGAGIQADLKTFAFLGVHGASVVAAVTAQNSRAVTDVFPLPDGIVESQIDAVMSELRPDVVKIGMLGNQRLVRLVARKLREWRPREIVLDPVMIAASGARLLEQNAVGALRDELVPIATVLTPNWPEAEELAGFSAGAVADVDRMAGALVRLGPARVLLKGGHLPGETVVDTLLDGERRVEYRHPRIERAEGHGTGCALASAVAAGLALGRPIDEAVRIATDFVHRALQNRYSAGDSKPVFLGIVAEP